MGIPRGGPVPSRSSLYAPWMVYWSQQIVLRIPQSRLHRSMAPDMAPEQRGISSLCLHPASLGGGYLGCTASLWPSSQQYFPLEKTGVGGCALQSPLFYGGPARCGLAQGKVESFPTATPSWTIPDPKRPRVQRRASSTQARTEAALVGRGCCLWPSCWPGKAGARRSRGGVPPSGSGLLTQALSLELSRGNAPLHPSKLSPLFPRRLSLYSSERAGLTLSYHPGASGSPES